MEKPRKAAQDEIAKLPQGLQDLMEAPAGNEAHEAMMLPAAPGEKQALPAAPEEGQPQRPKTEKELELGRLIAKRQQVIELLKEKNPKVLESRKKIAELAPAISGKGASHTMKLASEAEHLEFSIATEAYTPKKEKELIKRLRGIRGELSKHKEVDDARKAVDAERRHLHELLGEIKDLERKLVEARSKCDAAYAEVLAERKSAFEAREKGRQHRREQRFEELRRKVHEQKKREYDDEIKPYLKDYDDTVSMDEIVQIEKKEKKGADSR